MTSSRSEVQFLLVRPRLEFMAAKKRKKTKAKIKVTNVNPKPKRSVHAFVKPPGLRVEDLKPGEIVRFNANPEAGTPDEYHVIVPGIYGIQKDSICIDPKTNAVTVGNLPCEVDWDYELERLPSHSFTLICKDGRTIGKLFKRRVKKK